MSDTPNVDRRRMLRRTGLFLGGLAGLGFAAKTGVDASRDSSPADVVSMSIRGANWQLVYPERRRGVLPSLGQRSSSFGELFGDPDGAKVGEFYASSFQFGQPFGSSAVAAGALETHQFNLDDGTLVGIGTLADLDGSESVHAIIGGTGRYEGATGSYSARQNPVEAGGDGTAEFRFTIRLRSA